MFGELPSDTVKRNKKEQKRTKKGPKKGPDTLIRYINPENVSGPFFGDVKVRNWPTAVIGDTDI